MNKVVLIFLLLISVKVFSQDNDKIVWIKGELYGGLQDQDSGEMVYEYPIGKIKRLEYDKFFNSYYVEFYDEDNILTSSRFKYVNTTENGIVIVKDDFETQYGVFNLIEEIGKLLMIGTKKTKDGLLVLTFKNLK